MKKKSLTLKIAALLTLLLLNAVACVPERPHYIITTGEVATSEVLPTATQFTERPVYDPGTLVDYVVQSGDTLEHLAWRFGTTRREILFHNPDIPEDITT
ncbi:MAG TPA: LysM domain-containing protein [Anaerolineaceae bacterium]|nr:LysM domain-containing protein [Anaerolineaceae bacterium]